MGKLALKKVVESAPLPRTLLREAIARRDEVSHRHASSQAAVARAREQVTLAEDRLAAATAAVESARDHDAADLVLSAESGKTRASKSKLVDARQEQALAVDGVDSAKAALVLIEHEAQDPASALANANAVVQQRASAVVAQEAERVVQELERLMAELGKRHYELLFLEDAVLVAGSSTYEGRTVISPAQMADPLVKRIERLRDLPRMAHEERDWRAHPSLAPWRKWLEALQHDPDAELAP